MEDKPIKNGKITDIRDHSGRFVKGNPGNQRGRGKGSRNKATIALQALLEADGQKITKKAIAMALEGEPVALRLVVERLLPVAKERHIEFDLPGAVDTAKQVSAAIGRVVEAAATGEITPGEAATIAGVLELRRKAIETEELERRIAALEMEKKAA